MTYRSWHNQKKQTISTNEHQKNRLETTKELVNDHTFKDDYTKQAAFYLIENFDNIKETYTEKVDILKRLNCLSLLRNIWGADVSLYFNEFTHLRKHISQNNDIWIIDAYWCVIVLHSIVTFLQTKIENWHLFFLQNKLWKEKNSVKIQLEIQWKRKSLILCTEKHYSRWFIIKSLYNDQSWKKITEHTFEYDLISQLKLDWALLSQQTHKIQWNTDISEILKRFRHKKVQIKQKTSEQTPEKKKRPRISRER